MYASLMHCGPGSRRSDVTVTDGANDGVEGRVRP